MSETRYYIERETDGLNTLTDLHDKIKYLITMPECAEIDSYRLAVIIEKLIEDVEAKS